MAERVDNGSSVSVLFARPDAATAAVILNLVAGFLALNVMMPRYADDFCRAAPHVDLVEIAANLYAMYFEWTGRVVVMLINRLTFSTGDLGLVIFALLNSAALATACVLALACARCALRGARTPKTELAALALFLFLLWFTPEVAAEAMLWKTGAIQYFWGCVSALALLLPVIVAPRRHVTNRGTLALYCVACFIAGNWLENLSLAVLIVWSILLTVEMARRRRKGIPLHLWLGWLSWGCGTLLLFAAPGNYARAGGMGDGLSIITRIPPTLEVVLETVDGRTIALYLLFLLLQGFSPPGERRQRIRTSLLFALLALMGSIVMVGAPTHAFVRRVGYPTGFFLAIAVMCVFPVAVVEGVRTGAARIAQRGLRVGALLLAGVFILDLLVVVPAYYHLWQQEQARAHWLAVARQARLAEVELLPLYLPDGRTTLDGQINGGRYFARDITRDRRHWKNTCYARAHGVPAVYLAAPD